MNTTWYNMQHSIGREMAVLHSELGRRCCRPPSAVEFNLFWTQHTRRGSMSLVCFCCVLFCLVPPPPVTKWIMSCLLLPHSSPSHVYHCIIPFSRWRSSFRPLCCRPFIWYVSMMNRQKEEGQQQQLHHHCCCCIVIIIYRARTTAGCLLWIQLFPSMIPG